VALTAAVVLLTMATLLVTVAGDCLTRVWPFAWGRCLQVGRWALLAYVSSAGIREYVFILDHGPGPESVVLTFMPVIYPVDIPLFLAFSVARYHDHGWRRLNPRGRISASRIVGCIRSGNSTIWGAGRSAVRYREQVSRTDHLLSSS
jgi:hypothetical protein